MNWDAEQQAALDVVLQLKRVRSLKGAELKKGERELRKLIDRQLTMSIKRVRKSNPE